MVDNLFWSGRLMGRVAMQHMNHPYMLKLQVEAKAQQRLQSSQDRGTDSHISKPPAVP